MEKEYFKVKEFTKSDIRITDEVLVEGCELEFYVETWFDVDAKFGLHTRDKADEWVNLYAYINPQNNHVRMVYFVESNTKSEEHEYHPTANESVLILRMSKEYVRDRWGQTLKEYYEGSKAEKAAAGRI